jgi:hypothetical protein
MFYCCILCTLAHIVTNSRCIFCMLLTISTYCGRFMENKQYNTQPQRRWGPGVLLSHRDAEGHVTDRWSSPMSTVPTTKLLFTQTKAVHRSGNGSDTITVKVYHLYFLLQQAALFRIRTLSRATLCEHVRAIWPKRFFGIICFTNRGKRKFCIYLHLFTVTKISYSCLIAIRLHFCTFMMQIFLCLRINGRRRWIHEIIPSHILSLLSSQSPLLMLYNIANYFTN